MSSPTFPVSVVPEAPQNNTPASSNSGKRVLKEAASSLHAEEKGSQHLRPSESKRARIGLLSGSERNKMDTSEKCDGDDPPSEPPAGTVVTRRTASNFTSSSNNSHTGGWPRYMTNRFSTGHASSPIGRGAIYTNGQTIPASATSESGPKKLIIRNFKPYNSGSVECSFDSNWKKLIEAVNAIQRKEKVNTSLEELYQTVENMCGYGFSMEMYTRLRRCIISHVESELLTLLQDTDASLLFLNRLNGLWLEHCQQMIMIRSVFLFLDRTFVLQNASIISLWDLGLEVFRDIIMNNDNVRSRTLSGLLKLIATEREGIQIDRQLVKSLLRMMSSLGIYQSVFEQPFLKTTAALYESEGNTFCRDLEVPAYLAYVNRRLQEEASRIDYYLDFGTRKQLISLTEKYLIVDHMESFIAKGFEMMLHDNRCEELSLIYSLLSRTKEGLGLLKNSFSSYIKKVGRALVLDVERDKTLVADLLAMKKKLDNIIENCFRQNEKFVQAEKDAFDYFINTRVNKPAELVAKYMDSKLRSGNKESTDEELENLMDQVIVIFRFIQGKDVFEAFYKKDLAKRLLLGRSASVDAEKSMLSKLKQECGAGFTTKLEGMFKDIDLSKDLAVAFKQFMEHRGSDRKLQHSDGSAEFTVNVLTMGHWPSYEPMSVLIPPFLAEYQELFQQFYFSKHSGRKLQWQHSLSQFLLRARFCPKVVKELQVSMFQTLVLLLFNEKTQWTSDEIEVATKIEKGELERTLQSLACGRLRVLNKTPRGKEIQGDDVFSFNPNCNDKLYRIRISQVQMKETAEERSQTEEEIFQDRQYQIDAAIVRIMKMRKSLAHSLLISELFNQLRFPVKPVDLKKRIESLIEREYMCRDAHDSNVYNYVA